MNKKNIIIIIIICLISIITISIIFIKYKINDKFENYCKYVSSRGILKSCDIISNKPKSSITKISDYDFNLIKDRDIVYICGDAIQDFINRIFPTIKCKIILVTGDCDTSMPNIDNFDSFINDNRIIHWFSQNLIKKNKKLSQIPIGLDYHTIYDNLKHKWDKKRTPLEQENILKSIIKKSKPFYNRKIMAYSNFHFNFKNAKYGYDRKDAIDNIPENIVYYEDTEIPRNDSWNKQIEYAFVISPHGNGLDCHRTWEALLLGCIPIVKTSPLDGLYDELPVLIVKDWNNVNKKLLLDTIEKFKKIKFNYQKLELKYWTDKIKKYK
jgi:hypothetical protein